MAETSSLQVQMPGVDFSGLARAAIAEKLTEALVGADDAIKKMVFSALMQKVNERGQRDNYESSNRTPFVEWVAGDLIRAAAREALKARVEKMRPAIEAEIGRVLQKNTKSIAATLADGFVDHAKKWPWTVKIDVGLNSKD